MHYPIGGKMQVMHGDFWQGRCMSIKCYDEFHVQLFHSGYIIQSLLHRYIPMLIAMYRYLH